MNEHFKSNAIKIAICLAYPACLPALASEPFPSLPVSLSTALTPNVMLIIDTSGSMADCPGGGGGICTKKINSVKKVANNLIDNNTGLNWGVFAFDKGGNTGGVLKSSILPVQASSITTAADAAANLTTLHNTINKLGADGYTPLGETLLEVSRYWAGEPSYYSKITGNYTSPIAYRCQKNFNIFLTDGDATSDNELPGLTTKTKGDPWTPSVTTNWPTIPYNTWDAAGNPQNNLSFKVCENVTSPINSNISCPSILEGATTSTPILDSKNIYQRSIRDVAAYLYDRDFKYNLTGLDGDGKSWDDPKFRKQNVQTYTVGFDIDNVILKATAQVGHGQYFTAGNETELNAAMSTVVQSITASISNAGGLAMTNPVKTAGNKLFQPVFNPNGWYGELRCYDYASVTYDAYGSIVTGDCLTPNRVTIPVETNPSEYKRFIWTSAWASGKASSFSFDVSNIGSMSPRQQADLGATPAERENVVNFVRGLNGDTTKNRSHPTAPTDSTTVPPGEVILLGDITDAQPLVVTVPSGETSDKDYSAYKTEQAKVNRNTVFIGANDGMLHAFTIATMAELMGYVPAAVYPHLAALPKKYYGISGGAAHVYGVNGELRQADVKIDSASSTSSTPVWKTIVVGGLAQGGQGYFAIDATSDDSLQKAPLKWEWNDQHDKQMGYTFGAPVIYNVRTSANTVVPAVILANGYENDYDDTAVGGQQPANPSGCVRTSGGVTKNCNTSALYVVNAATGALIKKFVLDAESTGIGGLSSPAGVDYGQDGILDYVYAGDMSGKLWRFDLTDNGQYLTAPKLIFDAGVKQPITQRPAIKPVTTSKGAENLILFGTGKLLTDADRKTTDTQAFYAVLDDMTSSTSTRTVTDLQQREFDSHEVTAGAGFIAGNYRKIVPDTEFDLTSADEKINRKKKGWYINLPTSSERLVSAPLLVNYKIIFGTGIPITTEKCTAGGSGWVMGLDPLTGGVVVSGSAKKPFSFIDMNGDGKSTKDDQLSGFASGAGYVSGFSTDGIPTELTYVANASKVVTIDSIGSSPMGNAGQVIALQDANIMAVYTGNAPASVSTGQSMGRPGADPAAGGHIVGGNGGSNGGSPSGAPGGASGGGPSVIDKNSTDPEPEPIKRYKIETTIWREIK